MGKSWIFGRNTQPQCSKRDCLAWRSELPWWFALSRKQRKPWRAPPRPQRPPSLPGSSAGSRKCWRALPSTSRSAGETDADGLIRHRRSVRLRSTETFGLSPSLPINGKEKKKKKNYIYIFILDTKILSIDGQQPSKKNQRLWCHRIKHWNI